MKRDKYKIKIKLKQKQEGGKKKRRLNEMWGGKKEKKTSVELIDNNLLSVGLKSRGEERRLCTIARQINLNSIYKKYRVEILRVGIIIILLIQNKYKKINIIKKEKKKEKGKRKKRKKQFIREDCSFFIVEILECYVFKKKLVYL
jgi:hypothetical protein